MADLRLCPVASAHRRLIDCHEHWHAAADSYMEPDGFRMSLNALIQNLRNVTWLLQKQRRELPDFETWYGEWRDSISDDTVMKWLVRSRNRIVKESDLELLSTANIRLSLDWLHQYESSWAMPPRLNTRSILIRIMSSAPPPPMGVLTIQRKWVDKFLPEWELLDATAHAYDHLVRVMTAAHVKMGTSKCQLPSRKRECVTADLKGATLGCMGHREESRLLHINLADRTEITEGYRTLKVDEDKLSNALDRYGGAVPMVGTAAELVPGALDIAKRMLARDRALMSVAWIIRDRAVIQFYPLDFPDQESKRLTMNRLAEHIAMLDADGVVFIGESWIVAANLEDLRTPRLAEHPDRREVIQIVGLTRDGETADRTLFFEHGPNEEIVFGELWVDLGGETNFFEPIRRRWSEAPT
jgi:hypothetical protein